jgi:hypothetical protein
MPSLDPFLRNLFKFVLFRRVRHLRRAERGLVSKPSNASWSLCSCPTTCYSAPKICSLQPITAACPQHAMPKLGSGPARTDESEIGFVALMPRASEKFVGGAGAVALQ